MSAQFKFVVLEMVVTPSLNGMTDVVRTVTWKCEAQDGVVVASTSGVLGLKAPQDNFVDYKDLTESLVLEWVEDSFDDLEKSKMFSDLERQIANQKSPIEVAKPLPWVVT